MTIRIIGTLLFVVGMFFFMRFAWRKSERDWKYMQESNRKHNEWMVRQGREMERYEQGKKAESMKIEGDLG